MTLPPAPFPDEDLTPRSSALRANLRLTAVGEITVDPRFQVLRTPLLRQGGLLSTLDRLLRELHHPFRNWALILPEFRGFMTQHCSRYATHPEGHLALPLIAEVFLSIDPTADRPLREAAMDAFSAWLARFLLLLPGQEIGRYEEPLSTLFGKLSHLPDHDVLLFTRGYHPFRQVLLAFLKHYRAPGGRDLPRFAFSGLSVFMIKLLDITYDYWLNQEDPLHFARPGEEIFDPISHQTLRGYHDRLEELSTSPPSLDQLQRLAELPSHLEIVAGYRQAGDWLTQRSDRHGPLQEETVMESRRMRFLFHVLEVPGLSLIHEETLKAVNRGLVHLVQILGFEEIREFFFKTFEFLRASVSSFPLTALQCIEALGADVFRKESPPLLEAFLEEVIRFGFQHCRLSGMDQDWRPIFNTAHIANIRGWLALIHPHPQWTSTLLSALIINLRLTGALIRDTDLFQKDVTRLLNANIEPVFNLVKQFVRRLPVFFNEIGAEGEIRDVSTELDELRNRRDRLVHFLRKQCHVESTNLTPAFARNLLQFWRTGRKEAIAPYLPDMLFSSLTDEELPSPAVRELLTVLFREKGLKEERELLHLTPASLEVFFAERSEEELARRRVALLIRLYQLLNLKYNLGFQEIQAHLEAARQIGFPHVERLSLALTGDDLFESLEALLETIAGLKEIILSPETFPAREEVYQKRHIAVGIPSVYGRYEERKFDALALTLRLEGLGNVLLERLSGRMEEAFVTRATFFRVTKYLEFYIRALTLDGITSRKLENYQNVLKRSLQMNRFTFSQYMDILKGFSDGVRDLIHTHYTSHHYVNLTRIVPNLPRDALLPRYVTLWDQDPSITLERVSEAFLRDILAETFGLQPLDLFLTRLRQRLAQQEAHLGKTALNRLMNFDPTLLFSPIHHPNRHTRDLIHLGNKGFNLVELADKGFPVPPGFILTTEYFRCQEVIRKHAPARKDFQRQEVEQVQLLEEQAGCRFGEADNPLLVSVRSGALISMPGMMQTIHNVGINESIVAGLARRHGNPFFAWDNYRRFLQSFSMSQGVEREHFTRLMHAAKQACGVRKKKEFSAAQMEELAKSYKSLVESHGILIPEDPWEQLDLAIRNVLNSWRSAKARNYRELMEISSFWGTAVVVQQMIFGNLHQQSGSGVLFTAHPQKKQSRVQLWGDFTPGNQGEDIVGGLVSTQPVSVEQTREDGRDPDSALERLFPDIYQRLLDLSSDLVYHHRYNPQEIEFTFDGPKADNLYLLQTRDMVTARPGRIATFVKSPELRPTLLAKGIGVAGGALCGLAVFNLEQIRAQRKQDPATPLILVRYDTVPEDIQEISACNGLLTARGGQTSHAAIVAAKLGKTCVVGCEPLSVGESRCQIGTVTIHSGEPFCIDGRTGQVLLGWHPTEATLA